MKEKFTIEIADVPLSILSDEKEEFVDAVVKRLDQEIRDLTVHNKRCSKLDAALLCALDYCAEKVKADKRIRNLEAQISLYDANLRRLREENTTLAAHLAKAMPQESAPEKAEAAPEETPAPEQVKPAEKAVEEKPQEKPADSGTSGKLRQLELMLRGMKENDNQ